MSGVKDKMLVGERFRRALCSYPESAVVQEAMARELVSMVRLHAGEERLGRVLEIGAGSGLLTELLLEAFPVASLTANDLVGECREPLREIARRLRIAEFSFLKGDIEECGELPGSQDLVVSNATLQWLNDLDKLFATVRRSLFPGKLFAFTSFTVGNMEEIAMLGGGGLSYRTTEEIGEIAGRHFELLELKESREQLTFSSPREVLGHIRQTGVNGLGGERWSRSRYLDFMENYSRLFRVQGGVSLTYRPLYCVLRRREL
ncbi:malonyl-ACP O-methyltransferase BioC [Chlorobium phaeovibrioides]|uniref:Malonyl-[acyl-carrier protein] O-methyltransferase n=1 Tax=Chlorobium phaeovibrioides TaxID=1094 RepID=A0ABW9UME4_CHLPH|nr:malonyl-ACP O-methyltransferase BioC [Chlorobium phaeovibrioides]MWV54235.1 malonyl-ACP O-methyltransferase BioC [Chlorobium phaeovibrioides]